MKVRLARIAHARSGDKGDRADIGLFAFDAPTYRVLEQAVTAGRVAEHFAWIGTASVDRYPLPNLLAIKLVLNGALSGGAARSLRSDNLGKTLAGVLLRMEIDIDDAIAATLPRLKGEDG